MLYQLSYASLHGFDVFAPYHTQLHMPAGTNIELNTAELRVQAANQLDFQQLCEDQQT